MQIADVRDAETLRNTVTGDVVVNLAAVRRDDVRDKSEYQRTNVDGAENVGIVCEEKGIDKIVFTSTGAFMVSQSLEQRMKVVRLSLLMNTGGPSLRLRKNSESGMLRG